MRWFKSIAREVFGLFVEDGSFAVALLAWILLAGLGLPRVARADRWAGPALYAGLALVLIESVVRFARKAR